MFCASIVRTLQPNNFCINKNDNSVISIQEKSVQHLKCTVLLLKLTDGDDAEQVNINVNGPPTLLLGHGQHFADAKHNWHTKPGTTPMDNMIESVEFNQFQRPQY